MQSPEQFYKDWMPSKPAYIHDFGAWFEFAAAYAEYCLKYVAAAEHVRERHDHGIDAYRVGSQEGN